MGAEEGDSRCGIAVGDRLCVLVADIDHQPQPSLGRRRLDVLGSQIQQSGQRLSVSFHQRVDRSGDSPQILDLDTLRHLDRHGEARSELVHAEGPEGQFAVDGLVEGQQHMTLDLQLVDWSNTFGTHLVYLSAHQVQEPHPDLDPCFVAGPEQALDVHRRVLRDPGGRRGHRGGAQNPELPTDAVLRRGGTVGVEQVALPEDRVRDGSS